MATHYDAVVGGGSVAGLTFAAEASKRGLSVLLLEEDAEIGEPEKCDGLVSLTELRKYVVPESSCVQSRVKRGTIFSPSGQKATLDASKLDVVVLDRSAYDKQLAARATGAGVTVKTGTRVKGVVEDNDGVKVQADSSYTATYYVDATGPVGVSKFNRGGLIPAAKYEVEGDWINDGEVEVHTDQKKYPGFFAWVIPRGRNIAKVGVAGHGVNGFAALNAFLEKREGRILTRVACTIYIGGPIESFVKGRTVYVGESAGQVKPTTAGGIPSSAAAGMLAGRWVADSVTLKDPSLVRRYERDWNERYGKEYSLMKRLRHVYESLSNDDVEKVVSTLSDEKVASKLASTSFDYHASAIVSVLGMRGLLRLASVLVSAEAKRTISSLSP